MNCRCIPIVVGNRISWRQMDKKVATGYYFGVRALIRRIPNKVRLKNAISLYPVEIAYVFYKRRDVRRANLLR